MDGPIAKRPGNRWERKFLSGNNEPENEASQDEEVVQELHVMLSGNPNVCFVIY